MSRRSRCFRRCGRSESYHRADLHGIRYGHGSAACSTSPGSLRSALAKLLLLDGKHGAGLDADVAHNADAAARVGELDVEQSWLDAGDAQALIVVDLAVLVVL